MTPFTYQLAVDILTTCDQTPTAWTISTTSSDNSGSVNSFQTITSAGLFTAGPFTDFSKAGTYNVSVISVTLNGVAYTLANSKITNTAASPNSFQLTVVDPCATAAVTASTVAPITVDVF